MSEDWNSSIYYSLHSSVNDAAYNLAFEEYLLKYKTENYFLTYINDACVVIGKHQIAPAEARLPELYRLKIPLYRRISGGGAVYHDTANLNFSFIFNIDSHKGADFTSYISRIAAFLSCHYKGITVDERRNILIDGFKISGNAQYIYKNRALLHGTLLWNTNTEVLNTILTPENTEYGFKPVSSKKAKTANLINYNSDISSIEDLISKLRDYFGLQYGFVQTNSFIDNNETIKEQLIEKYNRWDWNFGYFADYCLNKKIITSEAEYILKIDVKKGRIKKLFLKGDKTIFNFEEINIRHFPKDMIDYFNGLNRKQGIDINVEIITQMF